MRGLTVGRLREMIAHLPEDTYIVTDDGYGWYSNIANVVMPNGEEYIAVTLERGDAWDVRQGGYGWDEVTA